MSENNLLPERIKQLRKRINLSQQRFGKKIGVSGKTISAYESGRCIPTLKVLDKIAVTYGEVFISVNPEEKNTLRDRLAKIKLYLDDLERLLY